MLASLSKGRRFVRLTSSKSTNQVSLRLPQRVSMSKAAQGWTQVTFKDVKIRYYGSHLSHEEEPKVVISEPKFPEHKPVPVHLMDENKRKQQIEEVEGMIYGTQVTYINTTKHDDTYAESVNGWIFGRKPRAPGEPYVWADWEPITYFTLAAMAIMCLIYFWAKPENSTSTWAREEIEERRILKRRREAEE